MYLDRWKRGLLAFLIVGILLVDFIKNQTQSNWKLVKKGALLSCVFIAYFAVYSMFTTKILMIVFMKHTMHILAVSLR